MSVVQATLSGMLSYDSRDPLRWSAKTLSIKVVSAVSGMWTYLLGGHPSTHQTGDTVCPVSDHFKGMDNGVQVNWAAHQ